MALEVLDPTRLRAELKQGEIAPVYLLAGADGFRAERTARWIRQRVVEVADSDLDSETVWAEDTPPARIAESALAYPMFGGKRFLWVRHAEALAAGTAVEPLLRYLERPADSTVLVFTSSKLDKRLKFSAACGHRGRVVEFASLQGPELLEQLSKLAQGHGVRLTPAAGRLLVDLVGEDLAELDQELAKLALQPEAAGRAEALDETTVGDLVARSRDMDAFALASALEPRLARELLHGWLEMRRRGVDVYGTAAILAWRLRQITQLREALDTGLPARDAGQLAGLSSWQLRGAISLAQNNSSESLRATMEAFRRADRRAKSSSLGAELAYDLAVLDWAARATDSGAA